MPQVCLTRSQPLAPLMRLPDNQLRVEIQQATARHPLYGLHLCHELLQHHQYYPNRPGLNDLVGQCLQEIGRIIQNQPEL